MADTPSRGPITPDRLVSKIATDWPATIAVFQRHHIRFCCDGAIPLREACEQQGLDEGALLDELRQALRPRDDVQDWRRADATSLVAHIQSRYHEPLRLELPRLRGLLMRVLSRHGAAHGARLQPVLEVFDLLQREMLDHMRMEDAVVFPLIVRLEAEPQLAVTAAAMTTPLRDLILDHKAAGAMLARIRVLTDDYVPPPGACATFRGLYHGLAQLEADTHAHVHLETHVLFPRAGVQLPG